MDGLYDFVIARECISHVRDFNSFLQEIDRVLKENGILYIADGNNALDIRGRYIRRKWWYTFEYGPIPVEGLRQIDSPIPYNLRRRKMIQNKYPHLNAKVLDFLAKETAGMWGDDIYEAVSKYLKKGQLTKGRTYKCRDPLTGEYNEVEYNPFNIKKKLENKGYSTNLIRPFYAPQYSLNENGISLNKFLRYIGAHVIYWTHPISVFFSPFFEIVARKNVRKRQRF